jgi:hypothetical protein
VDLPPRAIGDDTSIAAYPDSVRGTERADVLQEPTLVASTPTAEWVPRSYDGESVNCEPPSMFPLVSLNCSRRSCFFLFLF